MKDNYSIEQLFGSKIRLRILKVLAQNEELTISLIINRAKSNYIAVIKQLNNLIEMGLIQEKKFGRIRIYRYKIEDLRARSLKRLIEIWESRVE